MANDLTTFYSTGYTPDRLLIGRTGITSKKLTLISGQNLTRGALLGIITASGKATLSLAASSDGSQTPDCILAEDANATSGDVDALVYIRGQFDASAMTFGTGQTVANTYQTLRGKGIDIITAMVP
jgi:hypothetical protein